MRRNLIYGISWVQKGFLRMLATYILWTVFYYALLDPLRKFPGPKVYAVTRVPYWFACLSGNQVPWLRRLHCKYGPVVRFGPRDISYSDARAWKDIYGYHKGRPENSKDPKFYPLAENGAPALADLHEPDHTLIRRIMAPAFSDRALKDQEPLFRHYADLMVTTIRNATKAPSEHVVNMPLGLLNSSEYTLWVELVFKSISFYPLLQVLEYYPIQKTLYKLLEPKSVQNMRISHYRYSVERLDKRLAKGSDKPDNWNLIFAKEDEDHKLLNLPQMHSNAQLFMTAGTETSAPLLSGLASAFDSSEDMTFDLLAHLPFLNACIEEGLRMYPPVPSGFPRITPEGGNTILGEWMGDTRFRADKPYALQPFYFGLRNCLGMGLAWHEMRLLLAKVLYNFDLELCAESRDWSDQKVYVLWQKKPLMCRVIPVKSNEK
ncbi:cytochrome P450 monooxygenase-like protein [Xylariaceae sp. FL0662B]|nr:cytochrome P450 monooxygenase-like protein [Xylariaceae sp. FL0662B]